jgi:hypothetical protein
MYEIYDMHQHGHGSDNFLSNNPAMDYVPVDSFQVPIFVNAQFIQKAIQICNDGLGDSGCEAIIEKSVFLKSCVKDAVMTGSFALCASHFRMYKAVCSNTAEAMLDSNDTNLQDIGKMLHEQNGFGNYSCSKDCVNGVCSEDGCACLIGYSGNNCEIEYNSTSVSVTATVELSDDEFTNLLADNGLVDREVRVIKNNPLDLTTSNSPSLFKGKEWAITAAISVLVIAVFELIF